MTILADHQIEALSHDGLVKPMIFPFTKEQVRTRIVKAPDHSGLAFKEEKKYG